jgi:hypothetical protein
VAGSTLKSIQLLELERLVDSSLSVADQVQFDHKEYQGELYLWRHAAWHYFPFLFEIYYRLDDSRQLHVSTFLAKRLLSPTNQTVLQTIYVVSTHHYRFLLEEADRHRRAM